MGSCASVHRKSDSSGRFRASLVHSETGKHPDFMPSTPVKEKPESVVVVDQPDNSLVYRSQVSPLNSVSSFSNYGSKEDSFFNSQPWLESDCDDEFYSVNGDFTPSRGSTPLHSSIAGSPLSRTLSPQVNRALFDGRSPFYNEPNPSSRGSTPLHGSVSATAPQVDLDQNPTIDSPPTERKKKKLADLFRDSISENPQDEFNHQAEAKPKSGNATPYISGTNTQCSSSQGTPAEPKPSEKEKHLKSAQCCFPRLPSARGSKRALVAAPPAIAVDA